MRRALQEEFSFDGPELCRQPPGPGNRHRFHRRHDAELAFGLKRINGGGQVVGGRALPQLLKGRRLHHGVADIQHQVESFFQVVRPLDHHVQGLEASCRHMSLRCYFCLTAIEVEPDKNPEFVVQTIPLFVHLLLWPRRCDRFGRDAATAPSLGRECDAGNSALHIRGTPRYLVPSWSKTVVAAPGVL